MTMTYDSSGDTPGTLPTDDVLVRLLQASDLDALIRVDAASMGRRRTEYFQSKVDQALGGGKLQSSLVAELDGSVVGFVLASIYYGEFGQAEPVAVVEALGVDPAFRGKHAGQALMRQLVMNLRGLRVERIETQVTFKQTDVLEFLSAQGFRPAARICLELEL